MTGPFKSFAFSSILLIKFLKILLNIENSLLKLIIRQLDMAKTPESEANKQNSSKEISTENSIHNLSPIIRIETDGNTECKEENKEYKSKFQNWVIDCLFPTLFRGTVGKVVEKYFVYFLYCF